MATAPSVIPDLPKVYNITINENHVHEGVIPAGKLILVFGIAFGVFALGVLEIFLQWIIIGRPAERKKAKAAERSAYGFERLEDEQGLFSRGELYTGRS